MDTITASNIFDITMMLTTKPKAASNYTDAFDTLLDAYKDIGNNLPQFGKYAKLFGRKQSVRKVLVEIFGGILRFHKRAMGFFRRSGTAFLFPVLRHGNWAARDHFRSGLLWGALGVNYIENRWNLGAETLSYKSLETLI